MTAVLSISLISSFAFADDATTTQVVNATTTTAVQSTVATDTASTSVITSTTTEVMSTDTPAIVDEEVDQQDINLGDNKAELDAKKDFTAVVRQSKDYYCGPASLATLLTQLGIDTSEQAILDLIQPADLNSASGTNLLALKTASISLGNKTYLKKWDADTILSYISSTQDPVLIHDEKKGVGGHFSLIKSYSNGIVELSDTEAGNIKYSVEDFKHIYTGDALVISSDKDNLLLNDITTDMSDEVAANIWGKYVPVAVYAAQNGYSGAVSTFNTCIANALNLSTVAQRNSGRTACYNALGATLEGSLVKSTFGEVGMMYTYDKSFLPGDTQNVTTLNATKSILQQKLDAIKVTLAQKQADYNTKSQAYTNLINNNATLLAKTDAYNKALSDKALLTTAISTKQASINSTNSEINGGVFTQNGVTFSLGAVGNQITAQSSTFSKLSSSLSSTLSSLSGQITSAQNSLNNANANYNAYNSQYSSAYNSYNTYKNQANSYYSQYQSALSSKNYFYNLYYYTKGQNTSSNYQNYVAWSNNANNYLNQYNSANSNANSYLTQANNALSNRDWWSGQVTTYTNTISNLNSQKNNASAQVSSAQAELDRLNRLKSFGDAEMQRKRTLVATMQSELATLNSQLATAVNNVNTLPAQIATLKTQIAQANVSSKNALDALQADITATQTDVDARTQEIANEASFELNADNGAEKVATLDTRSYIDGKIFQAGVLLDVACIGSIAIDWAVVTIPASGAICSAAVYASTPVAIIQGVSGSTLMSSEELSTFQRFVNIGVGSVPLVAKYGGKVILTISKINGKSSIILTSDGTPAGEALLPQAKKLLEDAEIKAGGQIAVKVTAKTSLPQNVQTSLSDLIKSNWVRNWAGQSNGSKYLNDGRDGTMLLPKDFTYTEWSVNKILPEDAQRFIKASNGDIYFTADHYLTFLKIQ